MLNWQVHPCRAAQNYAFLCATKWVLSNPQCACIWAYVKASRGKIK
jgi:hypothetical protein